VQDVCDRITILFRGEMRALGEVKDLLQKKDLTTIEASGLTETQIEELRRMIGQMGITNASVTHPTTTLEDLFMRIVRENTRPGESSVGSRQA
jgi:ABC-2 type transport system ATP-binding protein